MSHYIGSVPDTGARPADWLATAPCKDDPEAMFPANLDVEIEYAKSFCRRCPAITQCGDWALETGEEYGVWGGLSEKERRRLRRRVARPVSIDEYAGAPHRTPTARTLDEAWAEYTQTDGDHILWTGPKLVHQPAGNVTANRLAFRVDRGRWPDGPVLRTCGVDGCVKPSHLEDNPERQRCGTRAGYDRHRRDGEVACADCRRANTDADNRLRRTGTTKVAV